MVFYVRLKENYMNTLKKLYPVLLFVLSIFFLFIALNAIKESQSLFMKIFIGLTAIIVLFFTWFYEYLKHLYTQAQYSLVSAQNPQDIHQKINHIKKLDKVGGMKDSLVTLETLLALDENNPQKAIDLINNNEKLFKANPDLLLIKKHSLFKAYTLLNNKTQAKKAYQELEALKQTNFKKNKMNLLYNWDQIEALAQGYLLNKSDKALNKYKKLDTTRYNPRELVQMYHEMNQITQSHQYSSLIESINPNSPFIKGEQPYEA